MSFLGLVTKKQIEQLAKKVEQIMSALTDYIAAQKAFNVTLKAGIADTNAGLAGIAGDVDGLKKRIEDLINSSGGLTPEDKAELEAILADSAEIAASIQATAGQAKSLDEATPPAPPPG